MLVSSPPVPLSSMSHIDSNTDRSHITNKSAPLIPPTIIPKHFNVPFAIQHGYFRCIRYLLQLCYDPNERDGQLRTPLILCSYVENDRWSLSIAQNLLEKGAKVALEDHARRNALHHACALQRMHLVQLYLSCLDFNIEAKDCEGNTCLHYVAITGNCEIADLLMKTAEKMDIHLDQCVNRDGSSKKKSRTTSNTTGTPNKSDIRPSTLSFGLLKIIFNENDSSYSTRLAGLCTEGKPPHHPRRIRHKKQETSERLSDFEKAESTLPSCTHYCSTEALVNELQTVTIAIPERKITFDDSEDVNSTARTSPRVQLLIQQHLNNKTNLSTEDTLMSNSEVKPKVMERHQSSSTLNYLEPSSSMFQGGSSQNKNKLQRPKTAIVTRNQTSVNAVGVPSRLSSAKMPPTPLPRKFKKKSTTINRPKSASVVPKSQLQQPSSTISDVSSYSQTLYAGRPLSAALQSHHRHPPPPIQRKVDSSCSIREAKGATSRYNKPEELFGLKPEELFGLQDHRPTIMNHRKTNDHTRLKRNNLQQSPPAAQQHGWQEDVTKLADLFNIHHSTNYRPSAMPPPVVIEENTLTELAPTIRFRRMSISKNTLGMSRSSLNPKQSTLAALNIPRRNSISQRSPIKVANT
ncbi:unnamed protein product [Rotaria socialis]|uniref:Uncharacterized protein n=1 Tax=Rotaria socialis TaxID=392032 RepID=A0A821M0P0_9BILA|nr:unnamed protein product [Rotaria socialis]